MSDNKNALNQPYPEVPDEREIPLNQKSKRWAFMTARWVLMASFKQDVEQWGKCFENMKLLAKWIEVVAHDPRDVTPPTPERLRELLIMDINTVKNPTVRSKLIKEYTNLTGITLSVPLEDSAGVNFDELTKSLGER